jgi:hypothetical protein
MGSTPKTPALPSAEIAQTEATPAPTEEKASAAQAVTEEQSQEATPAAIVIDPLTAPMAVQQSQPAA